MSPKLLMPPTLDHAFETPLHGIRRRLLLLHVAEGLCLTVRPSLVEVHASAHEHEHRVQGLAPPVRRYTPVAQHVCFGFSLRALMQHRLRNTLLPRTPPCSSWETRTCAWMHAEKSIGGRSAPQAHGTDPRQSDHVAFREHTSCTHPDGLSTAWLNWHFAGAELTQG